MQSRARTEENRTFPNLQRVAMQASTGIQAADHTRRHRFAGSFLCGLVCAALPTIMLAQAPPQTLPGYHTVVAGNVSQSTVTLVNGAPSGTPVHGSATGDGGPATSAPLNGPNALAVDSLGNLYIVDSSGPVRRVDTSGNITTFAAGLNFEGGKAKSPYECAAASAAATAGTKNVYPIYGDGCAGNEIYLSGAGGIAIDPASGDIYISESSGYRIRKISHATYLVSTVAGTGTKGGGNGDLDICSSITGATCSGTDGTISGTRGLAVDKHGNLYLADTGNSAIRLANFTTGQLTTVVNTNQTLATTATCTTNANATTAGAAVIGAVQSITFDSADNMYFSDATCNVVYKVAENPATRMVDAGSTISVVLGSGLSTPAQATFTTVPGTQVNIIPAGLQADLLGNLYVGESTGTHVWFWDVKTGNMHTVFGGSASPGNCYNVGGSNPPYNGCDGQDSSPATTKGTPGLALDAWGNLYIADTAAFYVHKLALGTNAPTATVPAGFGNALVHFGAGDNPGSVDLTSAPHFSFSPLTCVSNSDNTQDCPYIVTNNSSSTPLFEQAVVNSGKGLPTIVPLTSQAYPTCQPSTAVAEKVAYLGATAITLNATPGPACAGFEAVANAPHKVTYAIVAQPASGTLSTVSGNGVTYTPNSGFTGTDSFTYSVTDNSTFTGQTVTYDVGQPPTSTIVLATPSTTAGATATVTLPPYTPPVATAQSVTVANATATVITLAGTSSNGAPLTYSIATQPGHGTLSAASGNSVTYTPTGTYFGADSFTFTVNDGTASSAAAAVSLTVNPPAPTASPVSVTVNYQTATPIPLSGTGQGTLTYSIPTGASQTGPTHGTLGAVSGSSVTYTPAIGYSGSDQFVFAVSNAGGSSTAAVSITVSPAPVIPAAQPSSVTVVYNTPTTIMAIAGGGDGNPLTYKVVAGAGPTHGTLGAFNGSNILYTPNSTYSGSDSFQFTAADDKNTSNPATISITVTQPPPVANSQNVTTVFQTALPITLVATGPGTITYPTIGTPAHGRLTGTAPSLTYTPNANYVGADSFTFQGYNGAPSNTATVSITVSAPPVPTPGNQTLSTPYQTALPITLSATGLGTINYAVATQPGHGTLSGTAPALTYTPAAGYFGPDSFPFTATNPGGAATGTISITVAPPPPVAQAGTATVPSGAPAPIPLVAIGGGTIAYSVIGKPTHGTVTVSGAVATYTSTTSYFGADSFTFQANNGSPSNIATVAVTVLPPPPTASNVAVTAAFNTATPTPLAATELNGTGTITYQIVANPTHGTLSGTAPALTYTPTTGFAGTDTFTYTASNPGGASNVATVTITVSQGFSWATAGNGSFSATVKQGQTATYNLLIGGWTGASGPVSFYCYGQAINCSASPNPGTLNGTAQIPVTITIATTVEPPSTLGLGGERLGWFSLVGLGGCLLLLPLRRRKALLTGFIAIVAVLALSTGLTGCGSVAQYPFGTATGTYTFTVQANAGASVVAPPVPAGTAYGTQTITLIVQ
jgi:hypothetical protein